MGLKLEVGKKYTDRTGNVRGPMRLIKNPAWHKFTDGNLSWGEYGTALSTGTEFDNDLIAPWPTEPTGPVRTVTRKEIVPGVYLDGTLIISDAGFGRMQFAICTTNPAEFDTAMDMLRIVRDALEDGE